MNNVITNKKPLANIRAGDIYQSGAGELYIISKVSEETYCAISLRDGNRWENSVNKIEDCLKGLTFLGRDMTIVVN